MTYRIQLSPEAISDIEATYQWISQRSLQGAVRWYHRMDSAIMSLSAYPEKHPLAPESQYFVEKLRQMIVGNKRYGYRVLFTMEGNTVRVHQVRRGRQEVLRKSDFPDLD